jgi:hypothetical protein
MSTTPTPSQTPCIDAYHAGRPVVSSPLLYRLQRLVHFLRSGAQGLDGETRLAFGSDPWVLDPDPMGTVAKSMVAALEELSDGLLKQTVDLAFVHQVFSLQQGDREGEQLHGPL